MKIAYLITKFAPITGGGESHVELVAERMAGLGHEVEVITARNDKRHHESFTYKVMEIPDFTDHAITFSGVRALANILRHLHADILHIVNYESLYYFSLARPENFLPTCVFSTYNTPIVGERIFGGIGSYDVEKHNVSHLLRSLNIKCYIANSQAFIDGLKDVGLLESEIKYIPFGIDLAAFSPGNERIFGSDGHINLLCTSRFVGRKGIEFLIDALGMLPDEYRLHLTGSGTVHDQTVHDALMQRAHEYHGRIVMCEKRKELNDLIELYRSADIFVMPSKFEGFGLAALEAMACGKPVVATNSQGLKEFVFDGETGLIVDYGSAKQLVAAVQKIAQDKVLRTKISSNGLELAHNLYDVEAMVEGYEDCYLGLNSGQG